MAGRVVEGILKERSEARREYAEAIEAGRRAAIAEEERPDVFTLRVGNIMPGEQAVVRLTLNGPLVYSDGEATFRFPLVVVPRYIPGTPLPGPPVGDGVLPDTDAVPDASRPTPPVLLPGFPNPVRLSLAVELHAAGLEVSQLRSSLHTALIEETGDVWKVRLQPGERLHRDFILRFRVGSEQITTALAVQADSADGRKQSRLEKKAAPCCRPSGRGAAFDLEDRYLAGADRATLEKQIVETSLRFGVLSRFTAYLAVDIKEVVNPDGKVHRVTQPIEPAAGWAMLGTEKRADDTLENCYLMASRAVESAMVQADRFLPGERFKCKRRLQGLPEASEASPAAPPSVLDLVAYRRRAAELLREMQAAAARGDDRVRFLGVLAVQLHALLEDLATTGQSDGEAQPLREWLDGFKAWVSGSAVQTDVPQLWQRAEAVLTAFSQATGGTTTSQRRREGWWK